MMRSFLQDIQFSFRTYARNPGLATTIVVTLTLGIGANCAIFSVVNSVLLKALPYDGSEDMVLLWTRYPGQDKDRGWPSRGLYSEIKAQNRVFEQIGIVRGHSAVFTGDGPPERVRGVRVSTTFLPLLGAKPAIGRLFAPGEDQPGQAPTLVLSHELWVRRFGAAPSVVGRSVTLEDGEYTVIGVLEEGFSLTREQMPMVVRAEYWAPLWLGPEQARDHIRHSYGIIAKLKRGVTVAGAQGDMKAIAGRLKRDLPEIYPTSSGFTIDVVSLHEQVVADTRPALRLLLGVVGLVLLIACANVANLLLVRGAARHGELGIRVALGAGRLRIVRQLLTESLLVSIVSGGLGLLLASWGVSLLPLVAAEAIPRIDEIQIDGSVVLFTFGLSVLAAVLCGLTPAWRISRVDLHQALRHGGRSSMQAGSFWRRRHGLRQSLVVSELALSCVLLICAGLLLHSVYGMLKVDPGFSSQNVLSLQVAAYGRKYPNAAATTGFYEQLRTGVSGLPGVESVGCVSIVPFGPNFSSNAVITEDQARSGDAAGISAESRVVLWDYLETMKIPLLAGRRFNDHDTAESERVAIVDEVFAKRFWPDDDPIGKRFRFADFRRSWMRIVGVVGSVKHYELDGEPRITFYQPHSQNPWEFMYVMARTTSPPNDAIGRISSEVWKIDPDMPLMRVATMDKRLADSLAHRRFCLFLLGMFAAMAMVLAVLGLYGVMSYLVGQSTHEIGIRMALGAQPGNMLSQVLKRGLGLTAIGVGIGIAASFAATRAMTSLLYGVGGGDPVTFIAVPLLLSAVALLACYLPARRATKVDPMIALRCE